MSSVMEQFYIKPCEKCGGTRLSERIGQGFEIFICGIPVGHSFGTFIQCEECGFRTDSYEEPWKAIRAWNRQPMVHFIEEDER